MVLWKTRELGHFQSILRWEKAPGPSKAGNAARWTRRRKFRRLESPNAPCFGSIAARVSGVDCNEPNGMFSINVMKERNFRGHSILNLLVTFRGSDGGERSTTWRGRSLVSLSQCGPLVIRSQAARYFRDELFVRAGNKLVPTPRGGFTTVNFCVGSVDRKQTD